MLILEIVLLVVGAGVVTASFFIPAGKQEASAIDVSEDVSEAVTAEVSRHKDHIAKLVDDSVAERIAVGLDGAEASLEKLTNEKIMAVNEYSDSVIDQIHKDHDEAMFLYDMLTHKQEELQTLSGQVSSLAKDAAAISEDVAQASARAEAMKQSVPEPAAEPVYVQPAPEPVRVQVIPESVSEQEEEPAFEPEPVPEPVPEPLPEPAYDLPDDGIPDTLEIKLLNPGLESEPEPEPVDTSMQPTPEIRPYTDNTSRILDMHKNGMNDVDIARKLDIGVGEVRLIISLNQ